ncbi:glycosyltransferase family 4 protein [Elioraea rosea]|uniref:glycosyltransferase family 4 protein n=1 Tax=Elioraea rosea TaxID=2492390 RepID=UPI00118300DF|nr:glycosyltransferase family 4 protein [Elioraea rosea]
MKIAQLTNVDFSLTHFLLPLMRELRARGHEVVGICADGPKLAPAREEGFRIAPIPFARSANPLANLPAFLALVRLFREERFDLLHVHTPLAGLVGRIAGRVAGIPRIAYTAHGFYFHERMRPSTYRAHVLLERFGRRFTDVLMTQSAEDAETAKAERLAPDGAVTVIGNGVDPSLFRPGTAEERAAARAAMGVGPDDVVAVMIGRMVAEKGYPELFAALARVPRLTLACIGTRLESDHEGAVDAALAAAQGDPATASRLKLLGYRTDVAALLRGADLFVLPSHREGMPRAIIEAMMTGLPVVATRIRGAREQVIDGETGFLVPVKDEAALAEALGRLAGDPALRARMGAASLARARAEYDEAKVIARQIALLGL